MAKVLLLLAPGFEEIEALGTCDVLRRLGVEVTLAALGEREVAGAHGIKVVADAELDKLDVSPFDAVVLPGGMPGAVNLLAVKDLVTDFAREGKVTAAICAAPIVLSAAGVLMGRTFTMYPGFGKYLRPGEEPTGRMVEIDGTVVTGKGPGATFFFAAAVARVLGVAPASTGEVLGSMFAAAAAE
ncbi:MAG: DJ-1/PfpI family protein [Lentisphaeria bacterium]|nr:DJ-1/PfpI family protein [Lentisphaeria bacterium]